MVVRTDFFSLKDDYFEMVTDCSSTYTTVWADQVKKTVRNYAEAVLGLRVAVLEPVGDEPVHDHAAGRRVRRSRSLGRPAFR
jgi:hypothetical protein